MEKYLVIIMAAQVSLYVFVMVLFVKKRVGYVKTGKVPSSYYKTFQTEVPNYPRELRAIERHFENLFEMPVLFLIFGALVIALNRVDLFINIAATVFVFFRILHMIVHIGSNKIPIRMAAFGISSITLIIMWFYLSVRVLF